MKTRNLVVIAAAVLIAACDKPKPAVIPPLVAPCDLGEYDKPKIWTDPETNVQYLYFRGANNLPSAITPRIRVAADGTPRIMQAP